MVAYTKPQQRKIRHLVLVLVRKLEEFIDLRFERWQADRDDQKTSSITLHRAIISKWRKRIILTRWL